MTPGEYDIPSRIYLFILSLHFVPSLQSAFCILYLVCILYPVCSLQSAFCTDRLTKDTKSPDDQYVTQQLTATTTHELFKPIIAPSLVAVVKSVVAVVQPRSQGLSSLPPLVVGIETLVAAGHVTTQNLGGKKICWVGGVAEYFDCCYGKLCWFQDFEQSLKTTRVIGV